MAAVVALLAVAPGATAAVTGRLKADSFGPDGTAGTSFPAGALSQMDFNQANDKLYALEKSSPAIHAFDAAAHSPVGGAFPLTVSDPGPEPDIAVDNTAGATANNIYFVSENTGLVYGYDSTGAALGGGFPISPADPKDLCGVGVDSAGNVQVGNYYSGIEKYSPTGVFQSTVANFSTCHVSFDSNDDIYVAEYFGAVRKFTAASGYTDSTVIDSVTTTPVRVDTATHQVYVVHDDHVSVYDNSGTLLYEFAGGIPGASLTGIAIDQGTDDVYVADAGNDKIHVFSAVQTFADATVTPSGATNVTDTSADVNVTIADNNALPTNWRLEVSGNGSNWTEIASGQTAGGETAVATGNVTGLSPNTLYRFRAFTSKPGGPEVASAEGTFLTDSIAPSIVSTAVDLLSPESVRLSGYVNPRSSATTYRFEWGKNADNLPNRVPTPNGTLGAGPVSRLAVGAVSGLEAGTTYHYRLVAINSTGTTASSVRSFTTRTASPAGRVPELVSPLVKDPNAYVQDYIPGGDPSYQVSPDGNGVFYTLSHGTPDSTAGGDLKYLARRSVDGWSSQQMTPPLTVTTNPGQPGIVAGWYRYLSPDLGCGVVSSAQPLTPDATPVVWDHDGANLFRRDPDGSYEWITPAPTHFVQAVSGSDDASYTVVGAESDCRNVVFTTNYRFAGVNGSGIYRTRDGVLSDVAVLPNGASAQSAWIGANQISSLASSAMGVGRAVSTDASHVYFTALSNDGNDVGKRALYLYRDGQQTVKVSASKTATANRYAQFQIASRDGTKVAFMANYGLTPSSSSGPAASDCGAVAPQPCGLYVYDVTTDELVDVSATADPANTDGATVAGVLGASDDLSRVYFAAQGQLIPGEGRTYAENIAVGAGSDNSTYNIYLYTAGSGLSHVGLVTRFNLKAINTGNVLVSYQFKTSQVTPDGRTLIFSSSAANLGYDNKGIPEGYRYSADSDETVCFSCRRDGEPPVLSDLDIANGSPITDEDLSQPVILRNDAVHLTEPRMVSDDGGRIVFAIHDALTPGAVDGGQNVYLWDRGALTLLDTGPALPYPVYGQFVGHRDLAPYPVGMDPSGDNTFIRTNSALVASDSDGVKDLYDFRVGGGFAEPPAPPAPCDVLGDGCQGSGDGSVATDTKTSSPGGGNVASPERTTLAVSALSRKARVTAARRGVLAIKVRTSAAGKVSLSANAKLGAKTKRVATTTVRMGTAGAKTVKLRLAAGARDRLWAGKALRITVVISQSGARSRTTSILLPGVKS